MPTYEYMCDACETPFEKFQSMTAKPIKQCPTCGNKKKVRRLISAGAGLIFKGCGFYITDYRSKSYNEAAKADSAGGATKTETKSEGKTETKSDTKSETKSEAKSESKSESTTPATKSESKPVATAKKK